MNDMNKIESPYELGIASRELCSLEKDTRLDFACSVMKKVKVIKVVQMIEMLRKKYEINRERACEIIDDGERQFKYLHSSDEYLVEYDYYKELSDDVFFDSCCLSNKTNKLPYPIESLLSSEDRDMIDGLTIISNSMPDSEDFCLACKPWCIMFTVGKKEGSDNEGYLYQIARFHKDDIVVKNLLIRDAFRVSDDNKKFIKRIAIVDNEEMVQDVDYIGFSSIVCIKNDKMIILERRIEAWNL